MTDPKTCDDQRAAAIGGQSFEEGMPRLMLAFAQYLEATIPTPPPLTLWQRICMWWR